MQDDRYTTSYKEEYGEPDNRKKQFITTAEVLLTSAIQKERANNESIKAEYSYV